MLAMPGTDTDIMARDIMTERSLSNPHIMDMKNLLQVLMLTAYRKKPITMEIGREAIWKIKVAHCISLKVWAVPSSISLSLCLLSEI